MEKCNKVTAVLSVNTFQCSKEQKLENISSYVLVRFEKFYGTH